MNNMMEIGSHRAVIQFDPEIDMFRGEFLGLNGGADFYADSMEGLRKEGETSLRVFLEMCEEKGIDPTKRYSGKFQVRLSPDEHARAAEIAAAPWCEPQSACPGRTGAGCGIVKARN